MKHFLVWYVYTFMGDEFVCETEEQARAQAVEKIKQECPNFTFPVCDDDGEIVANTWEDLIEEIEEVEEEDE